MLTYIVSKYNAIMAQLAKLPEEIAAAESKERAFINNTPDGWAGLGKNDTQRQLAVDTYTGGEASLLRTQLSATKYAADLHGNMLRFIAAHGFDKEFDALGQDEAQADLEDSFAISSEELPPADLFAGL